MNIVYLGSTTAHNGANEAAPSRIDDHNHVPHAARSSWASPRPPRRTGASRPASRPAKTMSMMERCEKPALWYRMERLKRHGLALAAVQQDGMALKLQNKLIRRDE